MNQWVYTNHLNLMMTDIEIYMMPHKLHVSMADLCQKSSRKVVLNFLYVKSLFLFKRLGKICVIGNNHISLVTAWCLEIYILIQANDWIMPKTPSLVDVDGMNMHQKIYLFMTLRFSLGEYKKFKNRKLKCKVQ